MNEQGEILVRRIGVPHAWLQDLYPTLIGMRWVIFFPLMGVVFLAVNLLFALLFWLAGDCILGAARGSFADCFFFSVQTLGTIGYGVMSPKGWVGHLLVCLEAYTGLFTFAVMSGLAFAKFSVPQARVVFSKSMVVAIRNGKPVLLFRMANARGNQIIEVKVSLTMLVDEWTPEGEILRRMIRLPLLSSESPIFALSFQAAHVMNEDSPLFGMRSSDFSTKNIDFIVTFSGIDGTMGLTVTGRKVYSSQTVEWNRRFSDILDHTGKESVLDMRRFHETVDQRPAEV